MNDERDASSFGRRAFLARTGGVMALGAGAMAGVTACSSAGAGGKKKSGGAAKVTLVSPQRAGDNGPVDNMLAGLKRCASDFGSTTHFVEAIDPSSFESTLRGLGQAKIGVVVAAFPQMHDAVKAAATGFPNTKFIHLYADPYKPAIPNVRSVSYDTWSAYYLAGVLAAKVSKTGRLGMVGGSAIPTANANYHAYIAGAKAQRPDVKVQGTVVGSFQDPVKARQIATAIYGGGVDVITACAGGSSLGVVKAAAALNKLVIYDGEDFAGGAKYDIGLTPLQYGRSLYQQIKLVHDGGWAGGAQVSGIKDGITGVSPSTMFRRSADPALLHTVDDAFTDLEKAKASIVSGKIRVPFDTSGI
jgi:basic membrane protein A and related proteins